MKYYPNHSDLERHIDHYWIVDNANKLFNNHSEIIAYPGIRPECIILLKGHYSYYYQGVHTQVHKSRVYSFIHEQVKLDMSPLESFVIVQFKPRALSSIIPFLGQSADLLINNPIHNAEDLYGSDFTTMVQKLREVDVAGRVSILDEFFMSVYTSRNEGFISELCSELDENYTLGDIRRLTKYSYSTLERYFKKDTGLTPKRFQTLKRYKSAVEEIYDTRNEDWMHYVVKYGYHDQSHFIKEIKGFTSYTPAQLLKNIGLRSFRPENL